MLRKLLKTWQPAYIAAIFESGRTHRGEEYAEYKATRAETPDELLVQIPYVRRVIEALRIPMIQSEGFEADDVIGTFSEKAVEVGCDVVVVSSEKDMLQLVNENVFMLDPRKDDLWYDAAKVKEFMGVEPHQVADLLALMGDTIDNIPGAPGIGEKGARELIGLFGSVEAAMERAAEVTRKMARESLQNNRAQIELSKRLATIRRDVPEPFDLELMKAVDYDVDALRAVYRELEFFAALKELAPGTDTREKDLAVLPDADALNTWLADRPAETPLAVSVTADAIGLACREAEGRRWRFGSGAGCDAGRVGAESCGGRQGNALVSDEKRDGVARLHPRRRVVFVPAGCRSGWMLTGSDGAATAGPQARSTRR